MSATYYDWFWRECDYDRNRKKKNLVVLSSVEVDKESYQKLSTEDFSVQVKKLRRSVINSKLYQRLGLNEEDGGYGVSLEAKFGNLNVFEELPNYEEEEVGDEKEMDKENEMKLFASLEDGDGGDDGDVDVILDDTISSTVIKQNDGLIPIYDVNIPEEVPRINISFLRRRVINILIKKNCFNDIRGNLRFLNIFFSQVLESLWMAWKANKSKNI